MDPEKLRALQALMIAGTLAGGLHFERMLLEPDPDPSAGGGGGGGGGGDPPKTFTQADLDKIVQREKGALERKIAELTKSAESAAKVPDLEKQLAEVREQLELAGKTAEEKARIQAEQAAKRQQAEFERRDRENAELKAAFESERTAHRSTRMRYAATAALTEARAFPQALPDAIGSFLSAVELDFDDKGEVAGIRYGGIAQKNMREAATAFLKDRPYFASAPTTGGSGTQRPNGGAPQADPTTMSATELMARGLSAPLRSTTHAIGAYAPPSDNE